MKMLSHFVQGKGGEILALRGFATARGAQEKRNDARKRDPPSKATFDHTHPKEIGETSP